MARFRAEGDSAFEPRSRRPLRSPTKVSDVVNERIVNLRVDLSERGLDAGPTTIRRPRPQTHRVILLIDDLDIRVIAADTGEMLRQLTLDPNRAYRPRFKT